MWTFLKFKDVNIKIYKNFNTGQLILQSYSLTCFIPAAHRDIY